jgi:SH3 domain-containing YSC84-like protein 1
MGEGKTRVAVVVLLSAALGPAAADAQIKETERLEKCRLVLQRAMKPDGIPRHLLDKAECVAVIPSVKKAAFGVGGRWGKGAVTCRGDGGYGPWGPPLMISIGGASFGLQIGGQSTDHIFLIMTVDGMKHLLKSQFTLGGDASVAAGPKGRSIEAATDAHMHAEILTYADSRGLFAGVSLEGAVVKQDRGANLQVYGLPIDAGTILLKPGTKVPPAARGLVDTLRELSPGHTGGW